jgi:F-box domain
MRSLDSRKASTSSSSDTSTYIRPNAFQGHRDTLARIKGTRTISEGEEGSDSGSTPSDSVSVSDRVHSTLAGWGTTSSIHSERRASSYVCAVVVDRLLQAITFEDYLNLRLTSRLWNRALPQPSMPGSYRIPREILQQVFSLLAPCDFNAARHTCRKWFDAGIDSHLLRLMLRSAQCQTAYKADLRRRKYTCSDHSENESVSEAWLMSKRVATATRLSVDWRGLWSRQSIVSGQSRFNLVEQVNFRRVLLGLGSSESLDDGKTFTVSACGTYLLVRSGHDVFVYDLGDGSDSMTPVVRLAAARNILRVSMDTSSGRYAVAALLDNRTGVLWNLNDEREPGQSRFHSGEPMSLGMRTDIHGHMVHDRTESLTGHLPLRRGEFIPGLPLESPAVLAPETQSLDRATGESLNIDVPNEVPEPFLEGSASFCSTPESESEQAAPAISIAIQTRPSATFLNLGSPDDAPRSVAICPSRKCVAWGCRLGIELHWVDALTGGDLNRWFPLAAPSDHLYFLPQRTGVDSGRKLRLISSAAGPAAPSTSRSESLPTRLKTRTKTHDRGRRQSMTRLFFGSLPFPSAAVFPNGWRNDSIPSDEDRQGVLRTVDCDHHQAVPLSDGHHMLYTDPANGLLCLGSDAPLGGPTKLIRKAMFVPPTVADDGWAGFMSCYNAGQNLDWGVRIIAAHRDGRIILYNVPADLFDYIRYLRSSPDVWDEGSGVIAQSDLLMDDVLSAHANASTDPMMGNAASRLDAESPLRTVQIEGVEIGHIGRDIVDDIAVDTTNGGVRVWVFCRSGLARLLDIYIDADHEVRRRSVGSDGLLHDAPRFSAQEPDEGRRSPKGKERAHSDDEDNVGRDGALGLDGASDERDQPADIQAAEAVPERAAERRICSICQKPSWQAPEGLHVEILTCSMARAEVEGMQNEPLEIEILTDWRDECLFAPYVVVLN